jgi:polysaccharide biosynthesis protein PslH
MITPVLPARQATGSTALLLYAEILCLLERHQVEVVTLAGPDSVELSAIDALRETGAKVHALVRVEPTGMGRWQRRWRFVNQWIRGRYPFRAVWFWDPGMQQRINGVIGESDPDLILVEDNAMGVYQYGFSAPTIFTEHEVRRPRPVHWASWTWTGMGRWIIREWDWQRWRNYQRTVWQKFDRLQVFTERDAKSMLALAPNLAGRITVNPFGIEVPAHLPLPNDEPNTLVFGANFSHPPNVDAALWLGLEIMPLLREMSPGVRLFLVGSHPPREVRELARDDVVVTGWVSEMEQYLLRAAVVMAPVRTGGGMRVKVLQGMALGKPVVTTPRGARGLDSMAQDVPILVGHDAHEIARLTASLLASTERRRQLGCEAHSFALQHLTVDAYVQRLEALWQAMLRERGQE